MLGYGAGRPGGGQLVLHQLCQFIQPGRAVELGAAAHRPRNGKRLYTSNQLQRSLGEHLD